MIIEPLVNQFKATDLNTDTLSLRFYSRDPQNPQASAPGRWFKVRMSGDPSWGDAATTFFSCQLQAWVTPVKPGTPPRVAKAPAAKTTANTSETSSRDDLERWQLAARIRLTLAPERTQDRP